MRGISEATTELIQFARRLLQKAHPMTLRQLHYAIFSADEIEYTNTQVDYKRLSRASTYARRIYRAWELGQRAYGTKCLVIDMCSEPSKEQSESTMEFDAGEESPEPANSIPPEWMVDETRNPETTSVWENPTDFIETVKGAYRRDNWQDQPNYCEVWSEKGTVLASIRPVAKDLGITLRTCHGYGSTGMEQQIGGFFEFIKKPITVFYIGDHDPSGHGIEADIHDKVQKASGITFKIRRLAIHSDDIRTFNLPPQSIKSTDSRARSFERRFGEGAATVELDALPVEELRRRISDSVTGLLDLGRWKRALEVQEVEYSSIARLGETWLNLVGRNGGDLR